MFSGKRRTPLTLAVGLVALLALLVFAGGVLAQLAGSDFEIEDGNTAVDPGGVSLDWDTPALGAQVFADLAPGQNDDSFGQGTKEDTESPTRVTGSIPPNKSDLVEFGVYIERAASDDFLHLFWTRVQDPSGTTLMDFEINQNRCETDGSGCSANSTTPDRLTGDFLITYELAKGGTVPDFYLYTWVDAPAEAPAGFSCTAAQAPPCWGGKTDLDSAGDAEGSINTVPISSSLLGRSLDPYTFGEASVSLSAILPSGTCQSFGSVYLKSRSSDSFTSALKDYITPQDVVISNCGSVTITKVTQPSGDATSTFAFSSTGGLSPDITTLMDGQSYENLEVFAGDYSISESDPSGLGYDLTDIDCSASSKDISAGINKAGRTVGFSIGVGDSINCTFTNTARGQIVIDKVTNPAGDPQSFSFGLTGGPSSLNEAFSLTDAGTPFSTGPILPGSGYSAAETTPAGWDLASATCDDGSPANNIDVSPGETVTCTFTNVKRGQITVVKQTDPDGSAQQFQFVTSYGPDFNLADGQSNVSDPLVPGSYSVAESGLAGWDLDSATCSDGSDPATIALGAGESVTCTFTNVQRGQIIVAKETDPDGSTVQFGFVTDYGPNFSLADGQNNASALLVPGTYSVAESVPPGWDLVSATCDDGSDPATIGLAAGEMVTCTFNNTQLGKIIVQKQTDPDGSPKSFDFSTSYGPDFSLSDGTSNDSGFLSPGSYSVSESVPYGWVLTSANCDDGSDPAAINLAAGETVTCTFNNTQQFKVLVFVCALDDNTLYASDVEYGAVTKTSLADFVDAETEAALCALATGAAFEPFTTNPNPETSYTISVNIPE